MRILIAQEHQEVSATIGSNLLPKGFTADIATDGETVLWRAREGCYTVIILDLFLPKINGYDVCEVLRHEGITTPILLLTAKSGVDAEVDGLESGADDFLRKPYSFDVLVARLRALQRREQSNRSENLIHGDICYNPVIFECSFKGQPIHLTTREAALLEVLLRAEGKVVTKQYLLNQIWGMDFDGDPNIVDVYIGYLRRKFKQVDNRKVLNTVRGFGYRLSDPDNEQL